MPKLNRNEAKLFRLAARAGYMQAHIHLKEGKVRSHMTPGDTAEDAARFFAGQIGQAASLGAEEVTREFEQLPFFPEQRQSTQPFKLF